MKLTDSDTTQPLCRSLVKELVAMIEAPVKIGRTSAPLAALHCVRIHVFGHSRLYVNIHHGGMQWRFVADLIEWAHQYFNKLINLQKLLTYHHQSVLSKDRSFTANSGTKAAVLHKGRSSTANSGTKVAVLLGMHRCGSFPLLSV